MDWKKLWIQLKHEFELQISGKLKNAYDSQSIWFHMTQKETQEAEEKRCSGFEAHGLGGYCKHAYHEGDDVLPQVYCGGDTDDCDLIPKITDPKQTWVKTGG